MKTGTISASGQHPNRSNLEVGAMTTLVRAKKALKQKGLSDEDRLNEISRMLRIVKERLKTAPNINAWSDLEFTQAIEYYEQITEQASTLDPSELKDIIESIGAAVRSTVCEL